MDFPKSVPNVGLVGGKFVDENTVTGTPGSLIPAQWGNAVTTEILGVIQESGAVPDESNNLQLVAAVKKIAGDSKPAAATEGVAGVLKLATVTEVTEGVDDSKAVTPYKLYQRLSAYFVQATETVLGLVKIATQVLTNAGVDDKTSVTPKKLAAAVQVQAFTAFTTSGSAPAFTLAVKPPITAYALNQRFQVSFHASGGANPTLNISDQGEKALKQYDATATKVPAIVVNGQRADVVFDGTDFIILDALPPQVNNLVGTQGSFKNLTLYTTGSNSIVSVTVDEIQLENASGSYQTVRNVAVNPNISTSGISGLDTGTVAASTWYSVWIVWNSTNGAAGLLSLSATAPTLPSGWTHKARVGWIRTDASANRYPLSIVQQGRSARYKVAASSNVSGMPAIISGSQGSVSTPTWVGTSTSSYVPTTASVIDVVLAAPVNGTSMCAANSAHGAYNSAANPPPMALSSASTTATIIGRLVLESANVYFASNAAGMVLYCSGWEDNL